MEINKFFENYKIEFGEGVPTLFDPELHINQDGTTPMYRDVDGKLWAIADIPTQAVSLPFAEPLSTILRSFIP